MIETPLSISRETSSISDTSSTSSFIMKSPFIQSIAFTCLASACLPTSVSLGLLGLSIGFLTTFPYLVHKGFLYEAALIDLIARDTLSNLFPSLNNRWWHPINNENAPYHGKLIIGALPLASRNHHKTLKDLGVTAVCSVLEEFEQSTDTFFSTPVKAKDWEKEEITHTLFSCVDMTPMSLEDLKAAAHFIHHHISNNGTVYVHCKQGRGRSACTIIAYLMIHQKMPLLEAIALLRANRPKVSIRAGQMNMLKALELSLQNPV